MNPVYLRKAIAGVSVIFGLWLLWEVVISPMFRFGAGEKTPFDYIFFVPVALLMGFPGVLCSYFGFRLFREMSEASLRWVLGTFAVAAVFWIAAEFSLVFPTLLPERLFRSVGLTLGILVAVPAYLFSLRALLPMLGGPRRRALDFVGRGLLLALAWNLFSLVGRLFDAYSPLEAGSKYVHQDPWEFLGFLVPAGVAYGFFRASQYFLSRWRRRQEAEAAQLAA